MEQQLVSKQMDGCLNAKQMLLTDSQYTQEDRVTPIFYDKEIRADLEDKVLVKRWTFQQYSWYVVTSRSNTYLGINKFMYEKMIDAIRTIIYNKKTKKRKGQENAKAIAFLHQDMKLSPNTIHAILLMFDVKIEARKILKESEQVFANKPIPEWLQKVMTNGGA